MAGPNLWLVTVRNQLLQRILAYRLQQCEAGLVSGSRKRHHHVGVDQRTRQPEYVVSRTGNRLGGPQREAAHEHPEATEERLLRSGSRS